MKLSNMKLEVGGEVFPAGPVEWVEYCRGLDMPPERLWSALIADCKPLPPGHAGIVLAVLEKEGLCAVNLKAMWDRLGRKISPSTIEALEDKGWLVRNGLERGAGWKLKRAVVDEARAIRERVMRRMERVRGRIER